MSLLFEVEKSCPYYSSDMVVMSLLFKVESCMSLLFKVVCYVLTIQGLYPRVVVVVHNSSSIRRH
jgi:hypothetical protein